MNSFSLFIRIYGAYVPRKGSGGPKDYRRYVIDKNTPDFAVLSNKKASSVECIWSVYDDNETPVIRSGYFVDANKYVISVRPWKQQNQTFLL